MISVPLALYAIPSVVMFAYASHGLFAPLIASYRARPIAYAHRWRVRKRYFGAAMTMLVVAVFVALAWPLTWVMLSRRRLQ